MWCVNKDMRSLKELYLDVAGTETVTLRQEESPSHEPLGAAERELEHYVTTVAGDDGLTDALSSSERRTSPPL